MAERRKAPPIDLRDAARFFIFKDKIRAEDFCSENLFGKKVCILAILAAFAASFIQFLKGSSQSFCFCSKLIICSSKVFF
jgi:hypothetical protein